METSASFFISVQVDSIFPFPLHSVVRLLILAQKFSHVSHYSHLFILIFVAELDVELVLGSKKSEFGGSIFISDANDNDNPV